MSKDEAGQGIGEGANQVLGARKFYAPNWMTV
jgi:hypothetical protein